MTCTDGALVFAYNPPSSQGMGPISLSLERCLLRSVHAHSALLLRPRLAQPFNPKVQILRIKNSVYLLLCGGLMTVYHSLERMDFYVKR